MSHISLTYHIIWRTYLSKRTINEENERELYAYILGICKKLKCQLYRINSMPDHVHLCVEVHPSISLSDFVKAVKRSSSVWMSGHRELFPGFEGWANGYAAFTYSARERLIVIDYIKNQKSHHRHSSFRDEYEKMMLEFGLDPHSDRFLDD